MEATILRRPESFYEVFDRKPGADKTSTHYKSPVSAGRAFSSWASRWPKPVCAPDGK